MESEPRGILFTAFGDAVWKMDAYTGLVYTSECLDCDEILYRDAFLSFSAAEKERQALQMKEGHLAFQI